MKIERPIRTKNDRVFDMYEPGTFPRIPYVESSGRGFVAHALINSLVRLYDQRKRSRLGRYFYYTKDTARIARSGAAGYLAYTYSLGDQNAEVRNLTKDETISLSSIERFVYRCRQSYFWLGSLVMLSITGYIAYQYLSHKNLWPIVTAAPAGAFIMYLWLKILTVAEGSSPKTLPKGVIAFGQNPTNPNV